MKPKDCNTKSKKYVHLSEKDRYKIEGLLEGEKDVEEISIILRRDRSTIYREIKRGKVSRIQPNFSEQKKYRANSAQADYDKQGKNKERSLKIGKDKELETYIRVKILEDKFSPDAIIGGIKISGLKFESNNSVSSPELYRYQTLKH